MHLVAAGHMDLYNLFETFWSTKPCKAFFYVGHSNVRINALVQYCTYNIHVFSYDHGFCLGVHNPNFQQFMVKRPIDFQMLGKLHRDKAVFVPCVVASRHDCLKYVPMRTGNGLVTATAAARFYKLAGGWPINMFDAILRALCKESKKHYHFGPIPEVYKNKISKFLAEHNLSSDTFVNIEWANDLPSAMLEHGVDVFLISYPVRSS